MATSQFSQLLVCMEGDKGVGEHMGGHNCMSRFRHEERGAPKDRPGDWEGNKSRLHRLYGGIVLKFGM